MQGQLQKVSLPEKVDVIISEPIGFLLVHERMLEVFVEARDRFLKPGGKMFPSSGSIIFSSFSDESLYHEQVTKASFWTNTDFYGIDLSPTAEQAYVEYFSQPVVGTFDINSLLSSQRAVHTVDFQVVTGEELQCFTIPFTFRIDRTALMHGFGCWFDVAFDGTDSSLVLSTSPASPTTHWYQCRLLFSEPLAVNRGQSVSGSLTFQANEKFSYNITMAAAIDGTNIFTSGNVNLHDQMYHYAHA